MSTYKTGNPLGSAAVKDLFDNAENLDFALNSLTALIWTDRLGKTRRSFFGMESAFVTQLTSQENRFNTFIQSSGYQIVGDYTAGPLTLTEYNQLIRYNNELYKLTAATDIPFTTTGNTDETWNDADAAHFVSVGDAALRQNLGSDEGGLIVNLRQGVNVQEAINHSFSRNTYYVENYISRSYLEDWAEELQALIDADPTGIFVMPEACSISKTIYYSSSTTIKGRAWGRRSVVGILPDFTGTAAFAPISTDKQAVQNARIECILIRDRGATADSITLADGTVITGRGTTSLMRGIDITGTFNFSADDIVGSYLDAIIYADAGDETIWQTTQRARITRLDASNCNRVIDAPGCTSANNFVYGDWIVIDIKTTGSVKYGLRVHDIDGLQIRGLSGFSSFQVNVNGAQITGTDLKPFDPKASIADAANGISAETILIPPRAGGGPSSIIHLTGVCSTHAGRLVDTTSGNPAANNVGAFGIKAFNVEGLIIDADITDPSMGAIDLRGCRRVEGRLNIRRVNTQNLGSGALQNGTYSSIYLDGCSFVDFDVNDMSPNRNYLLESYNSYMVKIRGRAGRGATLGRFYYIQDSRRYHDIEMFEEGESSYTLRSLGGPSFYPYTADLNSTAPANAPSLNGILIQLNNTADTSVTDIPSVLANQYVYVNIRDNGATKLRNNTGGGGGLFSGIDDYTKGRGTILHFMRDPDNGLLVKI